MQESVLDKIGNTPLARIFFDSPAKVFAKLEYLNPGGSIKDRSAIFMIEEAEKKGLLRPGGTIVEASSGNQGISLAMVGSVKNYKVIITVSKKVSKEKLAAIQAFGAKTIMCPNTRFIEHPKSYHSKATELNKKIKNSFMPNQYFNLSNPKAHYKSLGPEIWKQTKGKITHFFAAAGTGGTVSGAGKYLKEKNPKIKVIAVDSANSWHATKGKPKPYKLEGIGLDFDTPCFDESIVDQIINVTDSQAIKMLSKMAKKHGLLVGPNSAAVAVAVEQQAKKMKKTDLAVMIVGDSGRAYLSKNYFNKK